MPSSPSTTTIVTPPTSYRGRPPRAETPSSRKRRAAAAAAMANNNAMMSSSGVESLGSSSVGGASDQSSQLRPAHSFTGGGGMNLFGHNDFDDLDNFVQYVNDEEDTTGYDYEGEGEEVTRVVSFESDEDVAAPAAAERPKKEGGSWFPFRMGKKRNRSSKSDPSNHTASPPQQRQQQQQRQQPSTSSQPPHHFSHSAPPQYTSAHQHTLQHQYEQQQQQQHHHNQQRQPYALHRPQSTPASKRSFNNNNHHALHEPPLLSVPSGSPTEIHYNTGHAPSSAAAGQRSRSVPPEYRTYNEPRSTTLPRMGSFDLDIDTIPASPRQPASISPFTQEEDDNDDGLLPPLPRTMMMTMDDHHDEEEHPLESIDGMTVEDDCVIPRHSSWRTSSSGTTTSVFVNDPDGTAAAATDMVPYAATASGSVEVMDGGGGAVLPLSSASAIRRQGSWDRRLGRKDIFHRHYVPSRTELEELQELEDYLGIFSTTTKHRFAALWRQLVPPLEAARQRTNRRQMLQSQASTSSMSTLSSTTNHPPNNNGSNNKTSCFSIVLKRGPIQFEQYQDFHSELILLTRGFVVARPNYQFIPRFQAGDLWTSVVQVQPTNPLSITLSCTSRTTSSHLTLTQLKQQQQYGCYTYEISCETPQEQASWLEALRRVVIQAHDTVGTNEKEMGGLGWQYRVVYVPFYTEAVTGNPVQKDKILAGSSGHVDLNALDGYNSYAPLHYATRANHVRVMRFLLSAGADVHVGDGYGRTPMYYAELHQLPESTIQLLEANGAQRSKKPTAKGSSAKGTCVPRSCQTKLFIAAMVLLIMACAASALLWKFGMLKAIGIGGDNGSQDPTGLSSSVENQPSASALPDLLNRGPLTVSPAPTLAPSNVLKKTPPPSPEMTMTPTVAPTLAAYETELFRLLEAASFDSGIALRQENSPQQKSLLWLLQNANLDSYTNNKKIQRYALAVFYYSTNGDEWGDNLWWMSDEDECMWFNKQVTSGYPACEISTSYDTMKTFTSLDLSFSGLRGTIPPELGMLSGLRRADLGGGLLTGPIPTELGGLNLIESFSARGNQITGTLPTELGNWELVQGIDLSFNSLSGDLPGATLGSMTWLTELTLEMNNFSGALQSELGGLTNLFKLALGGNSITGPIPSEIGLLTKLRYLYLELNQFTALPTTIGRLENLNVLSIFENGIQGPIPSEIGGLTKLGSLLLRSNSFSHTIPSELGLMVKLQSTLDLSFCNLSGPIPSELGKATLLRSLYLQSNKLNGAVPSEISQLIQLNTVRVESNEIVEIPVDLCAIFSTTFPNFYADCDREVSCSCCTYCCTDGDGCACQYAGTANAFLC